MKRILLFLLAACGSLAYGQNTLSPDYPGSFVFLKEIRAEALPGKNFRYEIAVRAEQGEDLSNLSLHASCQNGSGQEEEVLGFRIETRQEQDWTVYTLIGEAGSDCRALRFYTAVKGTGHYYFDDVSFYLQDQPHHWEQLKLDNPSFEEGENNLFDGYLVKSGPSAGTEARLSRQVYKTGRQSLEIIRSSALRLSTVSNRLR